ncbi:hypothetical protein QC760_010563 [Botrytis cinerea]
MDDSLLDGHYLIMAYTGDCGPPQFLYHGGNATTQTVISSKDGSKNTWCISKHPVGNVPLRLLWCHPHGGYLLDHKRETSKAIVFKSHSPYTDNQLWALYKVSSPTADDPNNYFWAIQSYVNGLEGGFLTRDRTNNENTRLVSIESAHELTQFKQSQKWILLPHSPVSQNNDLELENVL